MVIKNSDYALKLLREYQMVTGQQVIEARNAALDNGTDDIIGELYDLKNDPLELNNLYSQSEHFALREQMTRQLLVHVMVALAKFPRGMTTTHV